MADETLGSREAAPVADRGTLVYTTTRDIVGGTLMTCKDGGHADAAELVDFLFGDDFDRADRRIIDGRSEVNLDFALRCGFNVLEGFH